MVAFPEGHQECIKGLPGGNDPERILHDGLDEPLSTTKCIILVTWGFCGHAFLCFKHEKQLWKAVTLKSLFPHKRERHKQERQWPILTACVTQFTQETWKDSLLIPQSQQGVPPSVLPRTIIFRIDIPVISSAALLTILFWALLFLSAVCMDTHNTKHIHKSAGSLRGGTVWNLLVHSL